jgi:hypothetical protein
MYHPICLPHAIICLSHAIPLPCVCHMLYHSHLSIPCYTTPICHMLYHLILSVTFYTTPICLSHTIPLPSVTCYTSPICVSHAIPLPSVCHMLYHLHMSITITVELQPYGSKKLNGYCRALALLIHKTWDSADQNVLLISTVCILHSMHFPVWSMILI